jgi:hypothetical protein
MQRITMTVCAGEQWKCPPASSACLDHVQEFRVRKLKSLMIWLVSGTDMLPNVQITSLERQGLATCTHVLHFTSHSCTQPLKFLAALSGRLSHACLLRCRNAVMKIAKYGPILWRRLRREDAMKISEEELQITAI